MSAVLTAQQLADMDRTQLGALYADIIGYNPFDDPSITETEVRETLCDYAQEIAQA